MKATVDAAALDKFARGSPSARMEVKDGRLVIRGKGVGGDIPLLREEQDQFVSASRNKLTASNRCSMVRDNLPSVMLSDLRKTGVLSAECDGNDWRMSCVDDVHGACVFGKGSCRLKFSLVLSDAVVLHALLSAAEDGEVSIGHAGDLLVVRAGIHLATFPVFEGEAMTRKSVTSDTRAVANFEARDLRESLKVLKPVALVKDADPVGMKLKAHGIVLSANSPAGSVENEFAAECKAEIKFGLSYCLISALAARARHRVVLGVRMRRGRGWSYYP